MPGKKLNIGESVEIQVVEHGTVAGYSEGDLRLHVAVRFNGWSGSYGGVWVASADWLSFIESLRIVERDRRGKAALHAMSPDEFELHLEIIDSAGHVAAHGFLATYYWNPRRRPLRSRIEYWVEIDPSLLRSLTAEFAELAADTNE